MVFFLVFPRFCGFGGERESLVIFEVLLGKAEKPRKVRGFQRGVFVRGGQ